MQLDFKETRKDSNECRQMHNIRAQIWSQAPKCLWHPKNSWYYLWIGSKTTYPQRNFSEKPWSQQNHRHSAERLSDPVVGDTLFSYCLSLLDPFLAHIAENTKKHIQHEKHAFCLCLWKRLGHIMSVNWNMMAARTNFRLFCTFAHLLTHFELGWLP